MKALSSNLGVGARPRNGSVEKQQGRVATWMCLTQISSYVFNSCCASKILCDTPGPRYEINLPGVLDILRFFLKIDTHCWYAYVSL